MNTAPNTLARILVKYFQDYLPTLRRELLEMIRRYVNVDPSAVQINLGRDDGHEVLELSVALPEESRDGSTAKR